MRVIDVEGNAPDEIAAALFSSGACRVGNFIPQVQACALRDEAMTLDATNAFSIARMGRGGSTTTDVASRGDRTLWLDNVACVHGGEFLATLHTLSQQLRANLRMPIHGVEAHYALYPPGARYVRHKDRMQDSGARMISWVTYLNADWQPADGGLLRLYSDDGGHTDITPTMGTSVCFLSDIEHEVLASHQKRLSIAGWMRRLD